MEARAQGMPAPLRFLVIHHPLGTQIAQWRPTATATTTNFTLPLISAPFAPLQSKMAMIDGLSIVSATRVPNGPTGASTHEGGMVALMTGQPTLGRIGQQDHAAGGASIDQIFLTKSPVLGGPQNINNKTPFGSLQLAADIRSDRDEVSPRVMSYLDPMANQPDISLARRPLYPETQPLNTFNRIFGKALPTGTTVGDTAQLLAQKRSVLDFMRGDLSRLRTLAPVSERDKLDAQAVSIQQLESSIQASLGSMSTIPVCVKPGTPPSFAQTGLGPTTAYGSFGGVIPASGTSKLTGADYYDPANPNNHPHQVIGRLQLSLIKAAFACDLVRVATFMWSAGTNWVVFPTAYGGAHIPSTNAAIPHHPPSHTTEVNTLAWLAQIDMFYGMQTSAALQEFAATPDLDGNNLLDNTVVAYVTEVARASDHDQRNVPYLVFGGKNTRIRGGQFIKVTDGSLLSIDGPLTNRPTNDVWLALAPIFGVNLPTLGDATQYKSPLPGLVSA
jgi:hypothetical protein